MYNLSVDLASSRVVYRRPLPTLPDVMAIAIPQPYAGPNLLLGRYYPVVIETSEELKEMEDFLTASCQGPKPPDLLDCRPSTLVAEHISFAAYPPPTDEWPHLLLCHWPSVYAIAASDPTLFARGAYTTEMFWSEAGLHRSTSRLLAVLGRDIPLDVRLIAPTHAERRSMMH